MLAKQQIVKKMKKRPRTKKQHPKFRQKLKK